MFLSVSTRFVPPWDLSLEVNAPPESRVQLDLEILHLVADPVQRLLESAHFLIDLRRRIRQHVPGFREQQRDERVADFVSRGKPGSAEIGQTQKSGAKLTGPAHFPRRVGAPWKLLRGLLCLSARERSRLVSTPHTQQKHRECSVREDRWTPAKMKIRCRLKIGHRDRDSSPTHLLGLQLLL